MLQFLPTQNSVLTTKTGIYLIALSRKSLSVIEAFIYKVVFSFQTGFGISVRSHTVSAYTLPFSLNIGLGSVDMEYCAVRFGDLLLFAPTVSLRSVSE